MESQGGGCGVGMGSTAFRIVFASTRSSLPNCFFTAKTHLEITSPRPKV